MKLQPLQDYFWKKIGAMLLAKGVFFESTLEIVDKGGIKRDNYNITRRVKHMYTDAAIRIINRCKDIFQTRVGLLLLVIGFILQIIAQFLPSREITSIYDILPILAILWLLAGPAALLIIYYDEKLKQATLIELIHRIIPIEPRTLDIGFNTPAGMPYSEIRTICNIFLMRPLSFEGLPQEVERAPDVWLRFEIQRRYKRGTLNI